MTDVAAISQEWSRNPARNRGKSGVLTNTQKRGGALQGICPMEDCNWGVVFYAGQTTLACQGCSATVHRPAEEESNEEKSEE